MHFSLKTAPPQVAPDQGRVSAGWPRRCWSRAWVLLFAMVTLASTARANYILSVTDCNATNLTFQLSQFPQGPLVAVLGGVVLNGAYDYVRQTIVAVRPAGLAPGSYLLVVSKGSVVLASKMVILCDLPVVALCPPGPPGERGPIGPRGLQGLKGDRGVPGLNGVNGATGPMGLLGPVGATGAPGKMGVPGPTGATGLTGTNGAAGAAGTNGLNGTNGLVGAAGPMGSTGDKGATGLTGPAGATGPVGMSGVAGATGAAELTGAVGASGPAGTN